MSAKSGRHFLQIPGPTNVPDRVLHAIAFPTIDHRGPEFGELGKEVVAGMKRVFQTNGTVVVYLGTNERLPETTKAQVSIQTETLSPLGYAVRAVQQSNPAQLIPVAAPAQPTP